MPRDTATLSQRHRVTFNTTLHPRLLPVVQLRSLPKLGGIIIERLADCASPSQRPVLAVLRASQGICIGVGIPRLLPSRNLEISLGCPTYWVGVAFCFTRQAEIADAPGAR